MADDDYLGSGRWLEQFSDRFAMRNQGHGAARVIRNHLAIIDSQVTINSGQQIIGIQGTVLGMFSLVVG